MHWKYRNTSRTKPTALVKQLPSPVLQKLLGVALPKLCIWCFFIPARSRQPVVCQGDAFPVFASPVLKSQCLVPACKCSFAPGSLAERNSYWDVAVVCTSEANQSLYCCHPKLAECPSLICICASKGADVSGPAEREAFPLGETGSALSLLS